MERQSADLSTATGSCRRHDSRRPAQRRRSAAVGAQCRGRISGQSPHRSQGLPTTGRRGAGRDPARTGHVRQRRRPGSFAEGGTAEVSYRPLACNRRNHSAAWDHAERTFGCRQTEVRGQRPEIRGEAMKPAINHQWTAKNMATIEARGLRKVFGTTIALDGINLRVEEGRILGIIGPNGAGKTTALNAILGLTSYEGQLTVLGRDPWNARDQLMRDVSFIADVAVLPRWIRVTQLLDYVAGVHPKFDRVRAEGFLARTTIKRASKVRELSKGMVAQLHLAVVMAIDAKLLVLDEPTLGLDILYRKQFYDSLLNDYFDRSRTIVVTTHQVEEIQDVLTDLMFINRGRIVLNCTMEEIETRYAELMVLPEKVAAARALKPIHERQTLGRSILLFDGVERQQLAGLGDARTPSIADLFVAVMTVEKK